MSEVVLYTVLRIHLILMQIRTNKNFPYPNPDSSYFFKIYRFFLTKQNFKIFLIFSLIFLLKFDEPLRNQEIFIISLLSLVQIWVQSKIFFFQFFVDILWIRIRGSAYIADLTDPESQFLRIQRNRILSTEVIFLSICQST